MAKKLNVRWYRNGMYQGGNIFDPDTNLIALYQK